MIVSYVFRRAPLKVLPTYLVQILQVIYDDFIPFLRPNFLLYDFQAQVALERISVYLDEEEVTNQVSTLKRDSQPPDLNDDEGLGLDNAVLQWNEVTIVEKKNQAKNKSTNPPTPDVPETVVVANEECSSDSTPSESIEQRQFELRDISVKFPDGKLTVVTGPTASGKTALLVSLLGMANAQTFNQTHLFLNLDGRTW